MPDSACEMCVVVVVVVVVAVVVPLLEKGIGFWGSAFED